MKVHLRVEKVFNIKYSQSKKFIASVGLEVPTMRCYTKATVFKKNNAKITITTSFTD